MFKTDANVQSAFAHESQAYVRYLLFASIAEKEGCPEAARLFRNAAEAELTHARNHFTVMGGIGNTKSNLLAAATTGQVATTGLYPGFLNQAMEDRNENARVSFDWACRADKNHNTIFDKAYLEFKQSQKLTPDKYSYCSNCGNLFAGAAPASCDICHASGEKIKQVD
jgi:rubrerythrin